MEARKVIRPFVLAFLRDHPNCQYGTKEIATELGFSPSSVSGALSRMVTSPDYPNIIKRGQTYLYTTAPVQPEHATGELYEYVGDVPGMKVSVVRSEKDSELYALVPLADAIRGAAE